MFSDLPIDKHEMIDFEDGMMESVVCKSRRKGGVVPHMTTPDDLP